MEIVIIVKIVGAVVALGIVLRIFYLNSKVNRKCNELFATEERRMINLEKRLLTPDPVNILSTPIVVR